MTFPMHLALRRPFLTTVVALLTWQSALSAEAPVTDLPADDLVRGLILARPDVRAAASALQADRAEASRLQAGPHEFTVRLQGQARRTSELTPDGLTDKRRYMESQIALERTLRSGGKANQDQAVGEAGVSLAQIRRADAIHESSRTLLRAWVDWLRERATVSLWLALVKDQAELSRQADRRVKAGDAARTELKLQEAHEAQAQASLLAAQARESAARAWLDVHYPGLSNQVSGIQLRQPLGSDYPTESAQTIMQWLEERSHEWRLARAESELAQAKATRATMERTPDPTVGIYAASERAGAERVIGLSLSVPLSGAARVAADRHALAMADASRQQAEMVRLKVRAEASSAWLASQSALATWQSQEQARQRHEQAMNTVVRGWQLGEFSQADVLLARRQFMDAALAEISARAEARHAALRLKLDLHEAWEFDDE